MEIKFVPHQAAEDTVTSARIYRQCQSLCEYTIDECFDSMTTQHNDIEIARMKNLFWNLQ